MNASNEPLLDDKALAALNKTRPWLYFLGIVACLGTAFAALIILLAGIGVTMHVHRGPLMLGAGIALLLISAPTAFVQLGYAAALSRVSRSRAGELPEAVELACIRQRSVWIVNAFTVGVLALVMLFQLLTTLQLIR